MRHIFNTYRILSTVVFNDTRAYFFLRDRSYFNSTVSAIIQIASLPQKDKKGVGAGGHTDHVNGMD
jgi:hypothetical protein